MKKDQEGIPPQAWIRVLIFLLILGGLIWLFFSQAGVSSSGEVEGERESLFSEEVSDKFRVLGEKVVEVIPQETRETIAKTIEEKIVNPAQEAVEQSGLVEEIKKTITNATGQITGFPEKQKKEIKKQVIQEACDQLIKELENE